MARVLVIGDTHCPVMADGYVDFLNKIRDKYKTTRTVHIGDLVDNAALSFHLKQPFLKDPLKEYEKARQQVDLLTSAFKTADWLLGNHDALPYRWMEQVGVPEEWMKTPAKIWGTAKWRVHDRYSDLVIDGVIYRHGDKGKGGRMAALANAKSEFRPVVQGHHHSQAGVEWFANKCERVFGMQTGCGIDMDAAAMDYGKKFSEKPILGAGVVLDGHTAIFEPMLLPCRGTR